MKKFTETEIKKKLGEFDRHLQETLLYAHDEVYKDDPRNPEHDDALINEYCESYERIRQAALDSFEKELRSWGVEDKRI